MNKRAKFKVLISAVTVTLFSTAIAFTPLTAEAKTLKSEVLKRGVTLEKKSKRTVPNKEVVQVPSSSKSTKTNIGKKSWKIKDKQKKYKANEIIVKFNANVNSKASTDDKVAADVLSQMLGKHNSNFVSVKDLGFTHAKLVKFKGKKSPEELAKLIKTNNASSIEYAEPNYMLYADDIQTDWVPPDAYYNYLWGLKNKGQSIGGQTGISGIDINAERAWDITRGSSTVVVAVIDSGVDYNHPDLKNNIWTNTKEVPNNYIDDDGNGYVDDVHGWDFYYNYNDPMDYNGHGTHVAGTIAAATSTSGVVGVAPSVKIMPLRFLNSSGNGYVSDAVLAINYSKKMGVKLSNNSWGGTDNSQALYDSIKNFGGLFIAAAGNEGVNNDYSPHYPSAFNLPNILSVAAIDNRGALASFSNYGVTSVDVAAPGVSIYSCASYSSYQYLSGTSMATPHVSGVAALALSKNPTWTAAGLKDSITKTVVKLSSLSGKVSTGGMVNAAAAIGGSDNEIPGVPLSSTSITGTLNQSTDLDDVYSLKLYKGDYLTLSLSGTTGTDFDLYLYNYNAKTVKTNAGMIAYSEKVNTSTESITYLVKEDGTYFIDVYAFKGIGSYTLKYSKTTFKAGNYEDNSGKLLYTGTWQKTSDSYCSAGTYTTTNTSGSSIYMKFYGTGVKLTVLKNKYQGIAKVTIDSTVYNVDMYSATTVYKSAVFTKTGLTSGNHTIKIEWTGYPSRNARKGTGGTSINLDQLTIY
jgi:subtilisin family serine protease